MARANRSCTRPFAGSHFRLVCDREFNRVQVFTTEGKFVKEVVIAKNTRGLGAPADIAFSRDPQQRYMYVTDGQNKKVFVLDRQSLEILTSFGEGGRHAGAFISPHSIAIDSKDNLFVTETLSGRKIHRFVYKGVGSVPREQRSRPADRLR